MDVNYVQNLLPLLSILFSSSIITNVVKAAVNIFCELSVVLRKMFKPVTAFIEAGSMFIRF